MEMIDKNVFEPPQKKFLNLQETAEFLNLSPNTIYGLTSSGKLPHIKKTRKLIFERDVLVEWLQKKTNTL